MPRRECSTVNCDEILLPNSKKEQCAVCRGAVGRWGKRDPEDAIRYLRRLGKYTARMSQVVGVRKVTILTPLRRAARGR